MWQKDPHYISPYKTVKMHSKQMCKWYRKITFHILGAAKLCRDNTYPIWYPRYDSTFSIQYLKDSHTEEKQDLFSAFPEFRTCNNILKLQEVRFRVNIRIDILTAKSDTTVEPIASGGGEPFSGIQEKTLSQMYFINCDFLTWDAGRWSTRVSIYECTVRLELAIMTKVHWC